MGNKTQIEQPGVISGVLDELLDNMYINNVDKRLRELDQPSQNDCKRWIWELIQNAKDSIVEDNIKQFVDVKLIVKNELVVFKHNGSPFTAKALFGLLYKYSAGDINNTESTGRFGTGFLTTHTLSKIVSIEGDLYKDNGKNELCGFTATMFRDGIDADELLEGVRRMRKSLSYTDEKNNWTTYTYHLTTEQNKIALQLGLENFIANIAQTMLFCKELNTVELDNNGAITKIIRKQPQQLENEISISEFEITGNNPHTRKFLHKKLSKQSEELTKRFKTDRELRLMAAVEIDNENNLVENETAPSHFCVLPLVGSEKHILPIYLNSPDFEPDSERQSLLLDGFVDWEEHKELGTIITVRGINRLILKESIVLYDSLVSYICKNGYHKLYLLAKGLKRTPDFEKNFNKDWFEKEITLPYRDVLKQYEVVETDSVNKKLFNDDNTPNIIIPSGNKEVRQKIYLLATELFPANLPLEKYASNWAFFAWNDCGLFEKEDLCKFVSDKVNASNLPSYDWLNKFLTFIKGEDESLFKKYALIPNINGDLISLENETFAEGVELTDYMLDVLNGLGKDLTPSLLNNKINAITLPIKIDKKSIAEEINEQTENIINDKILSISEKIEKLLPLLNTIPSIESTYNAEFILKQKQLHSFTKTIFSDFHIIENTNNDIPEKAFQTLHKWLITQLMVVVSDYKIINSLPESIPDKIKWINSFIAFVSKEIKEGELDEYAIIPNQKGVFCFKKDLSVDDNIPEILKSEHAESFGVILKDTLLHKEINSINISSKKDINTVIELINNIFRTSDSIEFAIYLIHLMPDKSSSILHNSQKKLIELVQNYDYQTCQSHSISNIMCSNEELWSKANNTIIKSYKTRIEEDKTIEGLRIYLSGQASKNYDFGDAVIFLNNFYDYLTSTKITIDGNIVPNQNGVFCSLEDLFKDDNITKELKDILCLLNSEEDFRNILAETSLSIQPTHSKNVENIAKPIDETIKVTFADSRNWEDSNFKKAIALLIEYFKITNREQSKNYFQYSYNKRDSIELNVLLSEKDREIIQSYLKGELGIEQVKQKDNEIAQLKEENSKLKIKNEEIEMLLAENNKLKEEKEVLEKEIDDLKHQFENANSDLEKANLESVLSGKMDLLQQKTNEIAVIGSCVSNGLSKQQQKEKNEEARKIVKEELQKRLGSEKVRQQSKGNNFEYQLIGFDNFSNSPIMIINGKNYPVVVKSYQKQSEPFNINTGEWELLTKGKNSLFFVWDGNKINYIDILGLLRNQSHIDIAFSTENLDLEERLTKFSQSMRYFKDIQFKFSSFVSSPFGQSSNNLSIYFFDGNQEHDVSDSNSDIML